jgi:uncharacterized membrane protein
MWVSRSSTGFLWFFSVGVAVFSFVVVLGVTVVGFNEAAPHLLHYASNDRLPLYAHIVFGPLALLLMPFQFWRGLRDRHRRIHRLIGYTYAVSIGVAATGALLLLPRFEGSVWAATGFAVLAILWIAVTGRAILFARAGRTDDHRIWMTRSAALTFAAVVLRLMTMPLMATGMTLTQSYDITAWASWLLPLIAVEWIRRWRTAAPLSAA